MRRTFARTVLLGLQPGALLITGDLIDAKTRLGRGRQWEEEWQVALSSLTSGATSHLCCPESSNLNGVQWQ
jgi:hypothetical protein